MKSASIPAGRWAAASLCLFMVGVVHAYEGFDPSLDPTQVTGASAAPNKSAQHVSTHTSARVAHATIAMSAHALDKHHQMNSATAHRVEGGAH